MENPVSDFFGHSYEKAAIKCWLNEHNTSPMTGKRLQKRLTLNNSIHSVIEEWKSSHLSPSVLGDTSIQVNRMHDKKPSRKKKPMTGHKPSLAEQLGIHENTLPELVNWMTDEVDVIETAAMEMFALRGELDTTLKNLAEVKSNLVESNRIFNSECICVRDIELTLHPSSHALNPARAEQKSVLASVERDLALKKKEEGALLKSESTELNELRKRVATFTASIIDEKHTA